MEETWIKAEFMFQQRLALLIIPRARALEVKNHISAMPFRDWASGSPEALEVWLRELIEYIRPDLKGINILGLSFSMAKQRWELLATHQNFPGIAQGQMATEIKL